MRDKNLHQGHTTAAAKCAPPCPRVRVIASERRHCGVCGAPLREDFSGCRTCWRGLRLLTKSAEFVDGILTVRIRPKSTSHGERLDRIAKEYASVLRRAAEAKADPAAAAEAVRLVEEAVAEIGRMLPPLPDLDTLLSEDARLGTGTSTGGKRDLASEAPANGTEAT